MGRQRGSIMSGGWRGFCPILGVKQQHVAGEVSFEVARFSAGGTNCDSLGCKPQVGEESNTLPPRTDRPLRGRSVRGGKTRLNSKSWGLHPRLAHDIAPRLRNSATSIGVRRARCFRRSAAGCSKPSLIKLNLWFSSLLFLVANGPANAEGLQYNRDVRPILSEHCFRCHGPDAAAREADLRLDDSQDATADRGGYRVIDAGETKTSELISRITSSDLDQRMPPADSGSPLRRHEIEILREWIENGAEYETHWSFTAPRRPSLPEVKNNHWPRNAIDRFVLSRLEREGIQPSAVAERSTLIRRVTLDLTGLPPTLQEIDALDRDATHGDHVAYTKLVDRLLASPLYGERMALGWLDAARYADTNGYFTDQDRTMWPWRDWVIDAFNKNMPFDQFTIEQLAGDQLPHSTIEQKVATGFNRNHMVNNETGIIEEEFRVEYVVDRVDTTATVWMGLTLGCARCHDHKYDPISQRDFYRFFSLFNNVPEKGLSGSSGNSAPFLDVSSSSQQMQLDRMRREISDAEKGLSAANQKLDSAQSAWEATVIDRLPNVDADGLVAHYTLDSKTAVVSGKVEFVDGLIAGAAKFAGDACIRVTDAVAFDREDAFSIGVWIKPEGAGCVISKIDDANQMRGFDVTLRKGKVVVNLVHQWNRDAIQVSAATIANRQWQYLMVTYDGSGKAAGVSVFLDGKPQAIEIGQDSLSGTILNDQPLRIGRRQASASYSGMIDDVRLYDRRFGDEEVSRLAAGQLVRGVVARPVAQRSTAQKMKLRAWFVEHHVDSKTADAIKQLERLRQLERHLAASVPTTMVMKETEKPRQAFVLLRGQYDQQGTKVTAGVPSFLSGKPIANRLELANWLISPSHPLTARVMVNRLWQQLFGVGIVKSVDDFGTQGDWPTHGELLDWLAVELIESGWDLKHILRLIVTSATYTQSSSYSPSLVDLDRENRLLARGSRLRMEAEMLRDNALAVSGLLALRRGGPAVMPYQPAGLWLDVTYDSGRAYRADQGESLYRRSLYTFWKRQAPPPNMLVFDAPTRETCTVQRSRTNTPLQALALMNDPTFTEASRKLAERMMIEAVGSSGDRIEFAFRLATARCPTSDEVNILLDAFRRQKVVYQQSKSDTEKLLSVGESSYDPSLNPADLAAWTTVASMILSLDETITRP